MESRSQVKDIFVKICNEYAAMDHIKSRRMFTVYATRVKKDIYLTDKMFDHFCKFCIRDYDYTRDELRQFFSPLLKSDPDISTLEHFFK